MTPSPEGRPEGMAAPESATPDEIAQRLTAIWAPAEPMPELQRAIVSALRLYAERRGEEERAKALSFESVVAWANKNERAVVALEYLHALTKRAVDAETRAEAAEKVIRSLAAPHPGDAGLEKLLAEERAKALEPLRELWGFIEDGSLVRCTARDDEPGFAMRSLKLVVALKRAQEALAAAPSGDAKGTAK